MRHELPALPYDVTALEPVIDADTLRLHHGKHHAGYVDTLNAALAPHPELQSCSALWLLLNPARVPRAIRTRVRNAAGGHVNHGFFWESMAAPATTSGPTGALRRAIDTAFGSVEAFQRHFEQAGAKHFGSGWVWLVRAPAARGGLRVVTTPGHEHPRRRGLSPLLVNDVWEHAYYLRYQNRRAEYLRNWWSIVDWRQVARRFDEADQTGEQRWEDEGGTLRSGQPQVPAPVRTRH